MNLKSDSKKIGELTFKTVQFPAMRAFTLLAKLAKTVGPTLGALIKLDPNTELEMAGTELAMAFGGLDPKEAAELVPEILSSTTVLVPDATGGRMLSLASKENIDLVFSGSLMTLFKVVGFVLQVNYRDFSLGSGPSAPQPPAPSAP